MRASSAVRASIAVRTSFAIRASFPVRTSFARDGRRPGNSGRTPVVAEPDERSESTEPFEPSKMNERAKSHGTSEQYERSKLSKLVCREWAGVESDDQRKRHSLAPRVEDERTAEPSERVLPSKPPRNGPERIPDEQWEATTDDRQERTPVSFGRRIDETERLAKLYDPAKPVLTAEPSGRQMGQHCVSCGRPAEPTGSPGRVVSTWTRRDRSR